MSGGMVLVDVSGKAEVVLSTKGDLATWDTKRVRKGVSATNYTGLQADSAIADGLTYGATSRSTLTGTGSLLYSSGANTLSQLSAGTGEYTLKMNSGGTAPEWVNVTGGGGGFEELANVTATSGTSITTPVFEEKKYLTIWYLSSLPTGGAQFRCGNTSLDTSASYAQSEIYTDGTTVGTGDQAARTNIGAAFYQTGGLNFTTIDVINVASQQKLFNLRVSGMAASSTGGLKTTSGLWYNNTDMIDICGFSGGTMSYANLVVWGRD